jgi:hypothetical protein
LLNQIAAIHGTGAVAETNSYESISTVTVGSGGTSSVSFTSIPTTYKNLQIRCTALLSASDNDYRMQFNSDTGSNYSRHFLLGDGATASAGAGSNQSMILVGYNAASYTNSTASIIDILDYADTNKNKTARALAGVDKNGGGYMFLFSGVWRSTSAISSIQLLPAAGTFNQYSSFALYGIKG